MITNIENLSDKIYLVEFEEGKSFQVYLKKGPSVMTLGYFAFPPYPIYRGTPQEHARDLVEAQGLISYLYDADELASCAECGNTFHETEINMTDFDIDLCKACEESINE